MFYFATLDTTELGVLRRPPWGWEEVTQDVKQNGKHSESSLSSLPSWGPDRNAASIPDCRSLWHWRLPLVGCTPAGGWGRCSSQDIALRQTEHVLQRASWNYRGAWVPSETTQKWTRTKRDPQERQLGRWKCGMIIWEQGPQKTNAIVYDCIRSGERSLGRESPIFFDTVCAELRTHRWLSTIFSLTRRTNTAKRKPHRAQSQTLEHILHELSLFGNSKEEAKGIFQRGDFIKRSHCRLFISLWMFT